MSQNGPTAATTGIPGTAPIDPSTPHTHTPTHPHTCTIGRPEHAYSVGRRGAASPGVEVGRGASVQNTHRDDRRGLKTAGSPPPHTHTPSTNNNKNTNASLPPPSPRRFLSENTLAPAPMVEWWNRACIMGADGRAWAGPYRLGRRAVVAGEHDGVPALGLEEFDGRAQLP